MKIFLIIAVFAFCLVNTVSSIPAYAICYPYDAQCNGQNALFLPSDICCTYFGVGSAP
jgi:hypothetical protein